jgi:hypothetical protein
VTPAESRVIEAAITWMDQANPTQPFTPLSHAVEQLEAERAEGRPYTWGQLTEGDLVYAEKTSRWYEVMQVVRNDRDSTVTVSLKGMNKPVTKFLGQDCLVRRGSTGQAVDIVQVIFSGDARQLGQGK